MSNSNNSNNLKEKLIQALTSTAKVISDDFNTKDKLNHNKEPKKFDFLNLENFSTEN